jgi:quinol monooxygenase YgiN
MYGCTMHISAPAEAYQATHRAVLEVIAEEGGGEGLILHLAYATEQGFDLTEVWESREHLDAFNETVMPKAMARSGVPMDGPPPETEEFDPIGVMAPRAFASDAMA